MASINQMNTKQTEQLLDFDKMSIDEMFDHLKKDATILYAQAYQQGREDMRKECVDSSVELYLGIANSQGKLPVGRWVSVEEIEKL